MIRKLILVLGLSIGFVSQNYSMEQVSLTINGIEYKVPRTSISACRTLENIIGEGTFEAHIKDVNDETVAKFAKLMAGLEAVKDKKGTDLFIALTEPFGPSFANDVVLHLEMMKLADFFDCSVFLKVASYNLAKQFRQWEAAKSNTKLLSDEIEKLSASAQSEFAKYYFLVFGKNFPGIPENSYGFSFIDFDDFWFDLTRREHIGLYESALPGLTTLQISKMRLNDLEGLSQKRTFPYSITGILTITSNNLTKINAKDLVAFTELRTLDLSNNRIQSIEPGAFAALKKIENIWLNDNQLETLPANLFKGLEQVKMINLSRNKLKDINPALFENLPNLESVLLMGNNLKPENIEAIKKVLDDQRSADAQTHRLIVE